jgi:hypothetical protein
VEKGLRTSTLIVFITSSVVVSLMVAAALQASASTNAVPITLEMDGLRHKEVTNPMRVLAALLVAASSFLLLVAASSFSSPFSTISFFFSSTSSTPSQIFWCEINERIGSTLDPDSRVDWCWSEEDDNEEDDNEEDDVDKLSFQREMSFLVGL